MFKPLSLFTLLLVGALLFQACEPLTKTTKSGLRYKIHTHKDGSKKAKAGELMLVNFVIKTSTDSIFSSTYRDIKKPVPFQCMSDTIKNGRVEVEGVNLLAEGDSATFYVVADTFFAQNRQPLPPSLKAGSDLRITIKVAKIQTIAEFQAGMQTMAVEQKKKDQQLIEDYLAKNNIKNVQKTATGISYTIEKEGTGDVPKPGSNIVVNYKGKLLNGTVFDSSEKSGKPFEFPVGVGAVIPGWDESLLLLKKGSKANLYIPSGLAYGPGGSGPIPGNSVLLFEVEVVDIKARQGGDGMPPQMPH